MSTSRRKTRPVGALNLAVTVAMVLVATSLIVAAGVLHKVGLAIGGGTAFVGSAIGYASMRALARMGAETEDHVRNLAALQRQLTLFASVFEQLSSAVVVSSEDGSILANRKAREMGGFEAGSTAGTDASRVLEVRRGDQRDAAGRPIVSDWWQLRRAALGGEQIAGETIQLVQADGSVSWFDVSAGPIYGAGKQPLGAVMSWMDVTARNKLEKRQMLLARTSALVTSADHETKLSQSLARLFVPDLADWCTVDVLNDSGGDVTRAGAAHRDPALERALVETAPVGRWQAHEDAVRLPGGTEGTRAAAMSLAVPLHGRRGVVGVLTLGMSDSGRRFDNDQFRLAQDVARHAALAIENATLFRQTLDASRAKDEFLAILGHELRNPLAPITTALALMETKGYGGLEKEYRVLRRQVSHMRRLVDDLLDVTRIARGTMELRFESVDLADVVADGVEIVSPLLEKKSLRVEIDVSPRRFCLHGDRTRLAQVVANILGNAAKWSNEGQSIFIRARTDGGGVSLTIRDEGAGMTADLLPRIFDLFAQAAQGRDRAPGGLGVGLALVKTIVVLHQGTVTAASDGLGRGSEIMVWLPTTLDQAAARTPDAEPVPAKIGGGQRVLIVDDNVDAAESLGEMLAHEGFDVCVVHDGPSAIAAARDLRPAVALLDIGLPVMDGYDLGERLQEHVPGVRLIAVSGYAQPSDRQTSRLAGFEHHLAKPVDWEALKAALQGGGRAPQSLTGRRPTPAGC